MVENQHPCDEVVPIEQEPRHHLVIANEFVRCFAVEIAPRDRTLCHRHDREYLMYVAGDGEIVSIPRDGEPKRLTYRDGDCELSPAGLVHVVENLRETEFRNLVAELLPALGGLRRGSGPRIAAGDGSVQAIFEEKRVSVWSVNMNPDTQLEVHGPTIVARLFEESPAAKRPGNPAAKVKQVSDISWIQSGPSVLGSDLGRTVRAIVFHLGRSEEQPAAARKGKDEPAVALRKIRSEGRE